MESSLPRLGVEAVPLTAPAGAPDADAPLAKAPGLARYLADVQVERAHGTPEAGSTPLPEEWELLRAVYGGATRDDIETKHSQGLVMHAAYNRALRHGRLSAGLHVVTGHTGGGKTAFACNLALAAVKQGHPVVYVSLELDPIELAARLVALQGAVSWADLSLQRTLDESTREQRDNAIADLSGILERLHVWAPDPKTINDPAPTVAELRAIVEAAGRRYRKTPLVVFDYLQAPGIYGRDEEGERRLMLRERIASITMQLRHLSKRHTLADDTAWPGCPVLVLSTTARSNVKGEGSASGMTGEDPDLLRNDALEVLKALPKEAGEVEATAVTSWALAIEAASGQERKLTLRLAKNRRGPVGQWIPFLFNGVTGQISDDPGRYRVAAMAPAIEEKSGKRARAEIGVGVLD
jgi:hypothetical protein